MYGIKKIKNVAKLKCNNCGEVIESGIANIRDHTFDNCKAITVEKINDTFSVKHMPFTNTTVIDGNEKNKDN